MYKWRQRFSEFGNFIFNGKRAIIGGTLQERNLLNHICAAMKFNFKASVIIMRNIIVETLCRPSSIKRFVSGLNVLVLFILLQV